MVRLSAAFVVLVGLAVLCPANSGFTIEQVLSSPFPSDLTASPKGDAVAWVLNAKGVRNIWVASAPAFEARQITRFHEDDGQEISKLAWKPDETAIAFTRGDGANGRGEYSNPRSDPAGVQQEIWVASLQGEPRNGEPRKFAEGASPVFSPDGRTVAWLRGGQIWVGASDGSKPGTQWIHARGRASELRFSPDGSHLAFQSDRGDHGFIGLYNLAARSLTFLDASVDHDQAPVWSPDSKQVAFIRIPASKTESLWGPKPTAEPWSIRVADAATGKGREVWHAAKGMGSRFWGMTAENQLLWGTGDRLIFPWEGDGWLHLYSIAIAGHAAAVLLTPGAFEIEHAALDRDGGSVVYSANQNDIDRRHLWRVAVGGGTAKQVSAGAGIEYAPAPLANGRMALLHSDFRMPARAALLDSSFAVKDLAPTTMPPDFPAAALVQPQAVTIASADGLTIHGQLFLPPKAAPGKRPAVIFFHGGSRRQMWLGWHSMFYYHQAYGFNQYLASKGYIVLSVNYRSGTGYGEEFREAKNYGATGASEYNDVIGAGLFLRGRSDVDPARIGLWGGSYGGYLTALGLARASDMFAVGVDLHGIHDWNLEFDSVYAPAHEPDKRTEFARTAFLSSPLASIEKWKSPVLLIQGDDDRSVAFSQTVQVVEALRKQNVPFEELIFPDEGHDFLVFDHWLQAYTAAESFLSRYLKP